MDKPKTKSKRYKVTLSIETITALRGAMYDHLTEEPPDKYTKDYTRTVANLDKIISKHKMEERINGYE